MEWKEKDRSSPEDNKRYLHTRKSCKSDLDSLIQENMFDAQEQGWNHSIKRAKNHTKEKLLEPTQELRYYGFYNKISWQRRKPILLTWIKMTEIIHVNFHQ
jgi:hypothetical protein